VKYLNAGLLPHRESSLITHPFHCVRAGRTGFSRRSHHRSVRSATPCRPLRRHQPAPSSTAHLPTHPHRDHLFRLFFKKAGPRCTGNQCTHDSAPKLNSRSFAKRRVHPIPYPLAPVWEVHLLHYTKRGTSKQIHIVLLLHETTSFPVTSGLGACYRRAALPFRNTVRDLPAGPHPPQGRRRGPLYGPYTQLLQNSTS